MTTTHGVAQAVRCREVHGVVHGVVQCGEVYDVTVTIPASAEILGGITIGGIATRELQAGIPGLPMWTTSPSLRSLNRTIIKDVARAVTREHDRTHEREGVRRSRPAPTGGRRGEGPWGAFAYDLYAAYDRRTTREVVPELRYRCSCGRQTWCSISGHGARPQRGG